MSDTYDQYEHFVVPAIVGVCDEQHVYVWGGEFTGEFTFVQRDNVRVRNNIRVRIWGDEAQIYFLDGGQPITAEHIRPDETTLLTLGNTLRVVFIPSEVRADSDNQKRIAPYHLRWEDDDEEVNERVYYMFTDAEEDAIEIVERKKRAITIVNAYGNSVEGGLIYPFEYDDDPQLWETEQEDNDED